MHGERHLCKQWEKRGIYAINENMIVITQTQSKSVFITILSTLLVSVSKTSKKCFLIIILSRVTISSHL